MQDFFSAALEQVWTDNIHGITSYLSQI